MNRVVVIGGLVVILLAGGVAFVERTAIRDWASRVTAEPLPAAQPFSKKIQVPSGVMPEQGSVVEGGIATSTHYTLESSPSEAPKVKKIDPIAFEGALPASINLDVPFTSQSPHAKWTPQDEESCEEAAAYMVDQFYRGKTDVIDADVATSAINDIVAYEKKTLGYFEDTSASTTASWIVGYLKDADVRILPYRASDLKKALANGYPVIVPTAGKLLKNPNFHNGGPLYHMVVVKGYTEKGDWITNDSGTRNGHDYIYTPEILANAAHDWNNGEVTSGEPVMMIILPPT